MSDFNKSEQEKGAVPPLGQAEKTILVVEDDRTHRTLMEQILKECAFRTVSAENGIVALSQIDSGQSFDLIIMDWDMPKLDGLETTKEIRAREVREDKTHTPIIAFTSNRNPGDREQCLAAGMDAYLPKDVWMPRWRSTLIDSLQGLVAGNFESQDFEDTSAPQKSECDFDLDAFDMRALEQSAALLKEELPIAIDEYLEDAAAYIRDIREGLESGDAEKAARGSHPLKSNSKGFGLTAVSQVAQEINEQTRNGKMDGVEEMLSQLQDAFQRAEKRLREFMRYHGY